MKIPNKFHYFFPPAVLHSIGNIYQFFKLVTSEISGPKWSNEKKRLALLQGTRNKEPCFILGTGPSIKKIDLSKMKGENCIAVSSAYFLDTYMDLKPMYHVFAPVHEPYGQRDADEVVENLNATDFKERKIFFGEGSIPTGYYHAISQRPEMCRRSEVYYLDYRKIGFAEWQLYQDRYWCLHKKPFRPRSVLYCALQLAVYLGFDEIHLVGFDHDYIAELDNRKDFHFYDENREIERIEEPIEDLLYGWSQRLRHYKIIFNYLSSSGVSIYNSTEGGRLDQFPRLSYEKALNKFVIQSA